MMCDLQKPLIFFCAYHMYSAGWSSNCCSLCSSEDQRAIPPR